MCVRREEDREYISRAEFVSKEGMERSSEGLERDGCCNDNSDDQNIWTVCESL
jgi:uncharacterized protein (DUF2237 family)